MCANFPLIIRNDENLKMSSFNIPDFCFNNTFRKGNLMFTAIKGINSFIISISNDIKHTHKTTLRLSNSFKILERVSLFTRIRAGAPLPLKKNPSILYFSLSLEKERVYVACFRVRVESKVSCTTPTLRARPLASIFHSQAISSWLSSRSFSYLSHNSKTFWLIKTLSHVTSFLKIAHIFISIRLSTTTMSGRNYESHIIGT